MKKAQIFVLVLGPILYVIAQQKIIPNLIKLDLYSSVLEENRELMVYLPDQEGDSTSLSRSVYIGWRNDQQEVRKAEDFFSVANALPLSLSLAVGNEGRYTYLSTKAFTSILEKEVTDKFPWKFQQFERETHSSMTVDGFKEGLRFVFESYFLALKSERFMPERVNQLPDQLPH